MTPEPAMFDKPSYRIDAKQLEQLLGKQQQLQAITDAWNDDTAWERLGIRQTWPELAAAIEDALTEEAKT